MSEVHPIAQFLNQKSLGKKKGQRCFVESVSTGNLEIDATWTPKKYKLILRYRKSNLFHEFPKCTIKNSVLIEMISRSQTLTINGKQSKATEFILANSIALSLLDSHYAKIKVDRKFLIFELDIARDDLNLLSELFYNLETLGEHFETFLRSKQ